MATAFGYRQLSDVANADRADTNANDVGDACEAAAQAGHVLQSGAFRLPVAAQAQLASSEKTPEGAAEGPLEEVRHRDDRCVVRRPVGGALGSPSVYDDSDALVRSFVVNRKRHALRRQDLLEGEGHQGLGLATSSRRRRHRQDRLRRRRRRQAPPKGRAAPRRA
jgi:hypothetical protein